MMQMADMASKAKEAHVCLKETKETKYSNTLFMYYTKMLKDTT
jgi:hypothetical protein